MFSSFSGLVVYTNNNYNPKYDRLFKFCIKGSKKKDKK